MNATRLMFGCEAVARGAWEAGAHLIASYPGSPVTGIMDAGKSYREMICRWAVNEKVALEICAGVAFSGGRALAVMKHVGLNVAADPLFNLAYTGVRGALVVAVGDDPGATCSQNEQDSRLIAQAAGIPVLEPSDGMEVLCFTKLAFEISFRFDIPVLVRLTSPLCYGSQQITTANRCEHPVVGGFAAPAEKYLLLPANVLARHRALINALRDFAGGAPSAFFYQELWPDVDRDSFEWGIVCVGAAWPAVREQFDGIVPLLQVGCSFPLNESRIRAFASRCERLVVAEEGAPLLAQQIRSLGYRVADLGAHTQVGEFRLEHLRAAGIAAVNERLDALARRRNPIRIAAIGAAKLPAREPGFCAGCSHVGIFDVLRRRAGYVVGDIGCYTLGGAKPFEALHANLCMGASVGVLQGYLLAQPERASEVTAVIGDSTFFHSGIPSLLTAINNGHRGTLLILDNSGTAMTGFQRTAPNLTPDEWRDLLRALGVRNVAVVEGHDVGEIEAALAEHVDAPEFSVIVVKGECVQVRERKGPTNYRYTVLEDACTGCGQCTTRTNCPAISLVSNDDSTRSAQISRDCIGCGVCSQTCPERAIIPLTVQTGWKWIDRQLSIVPWHRVISYVHAHPRLRRIADHFERDLH
jgi:indolepyruvate ferredoxin oxidoreductase alpha subunit